MGHESLRHDRGRGRVQATLPSPPSNPCFSVECGFPGVDSQLAVEAGREEGESGERRGGPEGFCLDPTNSTRAIKSIVQEF